MKKLFFLLFTSCLFATNSFVVAATQNGMDREWLNVQKRVSDRKINLEQTSDLIGQQREEILTKLKSKYEEMKKLPKGNLTPEVIQRQRIDHADLNSLIAQELKLRSNLLALQKKVISADLKDFVGMSNKMRNSPVYQERLRKIKKKIEKQKKSGRMMRKNLNQLKKWSESDPVLKEKIRGLERIMRNLDQNITLDRMTLPKQYAQGGKEGLVSRRLKSINRATDVLADGLAGVFIEQKKVAMAKEQLKHNVDLFRLRWTLDFIKGAGQNFIPSSVVRNSISNENNDTVLYILDDINKGMMKDTDLIDGDPVNGERNGSPSSPSTEPQFKNF